MSSILIIDDEETLRVALSLTLKELGYSVLEASNGREGLALLQSKPTELVLLDIFMRPALLSCREEDRIAHSIFFR